MKGKPVVLRMEKPIFTYKEMMKASSSKVMSSRNYKLQKLSGTALSERKFMFLCSFDELEVEL